MNPNDKYNWFGFNFGDKNGFYYVIDGTRGRVFVYDMDINLLGVFGGGLNTGKQLGTFGFSVRKKPLKKSRKPAKKK